MNSISEGAKELFKASSALLNQPIVKERVKEVASSVTFVFGLIEIYDLYKIARGDHKISTDVYPKSPRWIQVLNKVVIVCAKISLILSAAVSRPGVFIISSLVGSIFSFGPNTLFTINPWHPRHVVSIAAVIFAIPSVLQSTCIGISWIGKKVRHYRNVPVNGEAPNYWLTDSKVRLMTLFNTITSRPTLHFGNLLVSIIINS